MEVIIISSSDQFNSEIPTVVRLFDAGLETFHLRKPKFSTKKMKEYLDMIPTKYHSHIIIHSHHKLLRSYNLKGIHLTKSHRKNKWKLFKLWLRKKIFGQKFTVSRSIKGVQEFNSSFSLYDYVIVSPVFDIVKNGRKQRDGIDKSLIKKLLSNKKGNVFAMGGITTEKMSELNDLGFDGAVFHRNLWKQHDPVKSFKEIIQV